VDTYVLCESLFLPYEYLVGQVKNDLEALNGPEIEFEQMQLERGDTHVSAVCQFSSKSARRLKI